MVRDPHSFAEPDRVRVHHIDLELDVRFDERRLHGAATLDFDSSGAETLALDTRGLAVESVETSGPGSEWNAAAFEWGAEDAVLGRALRIVLPPGARRARVRYRTGPDASALQWLEPAQTSGKRQPFLFTQSQAIHARSWIPCQDTPGVRVTYSARVAVPAPLRAVMSAEMEAGGGECRFHMPQPVPSYLIALAVGDLDFRPLGARSGIYAEPEVVEGAAREFEDTEAMIGAVEEMYGPYAWGRYDLLVLPPSFPFGGMENPRLTFATPTVLAGDKSMVALVAHELAHSWSGNLVTNATWEDFWLNEGFTVYLERRILERLYGRARAEMEAQVARGELEREMASLEARDRVLHIDLHGRDPDAGFTLVPYEKGALFLRHLEEVFGRERWDAFLRSYFGHFAFQSITTADFLRYLQQELLRGEHERASRVPIHEWLHGTGIPESAPEARSDALARVGAQAALPARAVETGGWSTHEWLHFLRSLPADAGVERMAELDAAFGLTRAGNAEIAAQWLRMAVRQGYEPAYGRLEEFLVSVGRRKFLKPLYEELVKTPEGRARAQAIYAKARAGYHPIAQATVDRIVGGK